MSDTGRRIVRSGAYALLATAFVLACSLLLPEEQAGTQTAMQSGPTELPAVAGSTDYHPPEPDAGQ
jgi:hypothetical protein